MVFTFDKFFEIAIELTCVGFELTATEFCADTLTN